MNVEAETEESILPAYLADEWELWRLAMQDGEEYFSGSFADWECSNDGLIRAQRISGRDVVVQTITLDGFLAYADRSGEPLTNEFRERYAASLCR